MKYVQNDFTRHTEYDPTKCPKQNGTYNYFDCHDFSRRCGTFRVVDCCETAGPDRDVVECLTCGHQRSVSCRFDDEYS